jgi:nucleoid DNA-binding protein
MTKAELVDQVAETVQLPKNKTDAVITRFLQGIMEALHAGDHVELRGFGSFRLRHRQARAGRNPRTGNPVQIPAKAIPSFTAGKAFQETVQTRSVSSDGTNGVAAHGQTMER